MSTSTGLKKGEFIASLDCGTTSTRFIIFDEYAKIVAVHQTEFEQITPHAGWHEQRPEDLVTATKTCIRRAVEKLEEKGWDKSSIKGMGITNQRETTVCWSRTTGKSLCNCIVWDDTRTTSVVRAFTHKLEEEGIEIDEEVDVDVEISHVEHAAAADGDTMGNGVREEAFAEHGEIQHGGGGRVMNMMGKAMQNLGLGGRGKPVIAKSRRKGMDGLVDITGIPLSTYFSAVKLRWMLDHYLEVREAHESDDLMFGTVDSWLVYNLTGAVEGGIHIMDVTNASRSLLMSIQDLTWHPPLLRFFEFRPSILPRIVSSSEVYAKISSEAETPLTGIPIAGIVGDQQAALVGNKCLKRGEAKNTYGTGSFVLFNTGEKVVRSQSGLISTVAFQTGPHARPVYALEGPIAVAGSAIKWLRDNVNLINDASEMDKLAGSVDHTGGVYFVTGFSGLLAPYWDQEATGALIGLTSYTTSAHIARATLEAMCFQTRAVLDVIEKESRQKLDTLKVDGGVTNSDLAMQIQADIGNFKVSRPAMRESTALGSALLAAHALGLFGWDLNRPETLSKVNTAGVDVFEPRLTDQERTRMYYGWDKAVERVRSWYTIQEEDEAEQRFEKESGLQ
ncbi:hypothetical protein BD324DRAFT_616215 [Kockovaella imperatae]|uniref:glycerol kinase n=1 Tax=Kockovaella imperatae TaxID=4999 RepID=A0A1Y1UPV3_9TREE|nr:hypothetical protein BD324DRAFT_616215 [Kockovaella imperatae]ORX40088.1 hypothetical protein BD324DRAFT_616215 [Kockovaella imperatae]